MYSAYSRDPGIFDKIFFIPLGWKPSVTLTPQKPFNTQKLES